MSLIVTDSFKANLLTNQSASPIYKVEILSLDDGNSNVATVDLTESISSIGSIARRASYEIGKMTPSSHTISIKDSKEFLANILYALRKKFGTDLWMDKEIVINVGFKGTNIDDLIEIYRGKINTKSEDRINGNISINSSDVLKDLHDTKACTMIDNSSVWEYNDGTLDSRGFQRVIKYGTHQLIKNTGDSSPTQDREDPFTMTKGFPNIGSARPDGSALTFLPNNTVWYFPFQNDIDIDSAQWETGGALRLYYWDYIDSVWRPFRTDDWDAAGRISISKPNNFGVYVSFQDRSNIVLQEATNFSDYIKGIGTHWGDDDDALDPAIAIETVSAVDANPIRIVHDLFTSSRFLGDSVLLLDFLDFDETNASNIDFSWDRVFDFYEIGNAKINTNYDSKTTLMKIINEIAHVTGFSVIGGAKKDKTAQGGGTDHRVRLIDISPLNNNPDCGGSIVTNLVYSTKNEISGFSVVTSSDNIKTKVLATNFDSSTSTKDSFDTKEKSRALVGVEVERILQFGTDENPPVYYYNSGNFVQGVVERYFNLMSIAFERFNLAIGKSGLLIEAGDLIDVHDELTDETLTVQVYETNNNLNNFDTKIGGNRFPIQFGPDASEPLKLWAFFDCAFFSDDGVVPPNGGGPNGETYHFF